MDEDRREGGFTLVELIEPALAFDATADQRPTAGSVAYAASGATVTPATAGWR
jgi:hypothetical protein